MTSAEKTLGNSYLWEPASVGNTIIYLPVSLLLSNAALREVFSMDTWNNILSEEDREKLRSFLPKNNSSETIQNIIFELFNFSSTYWGKEHPLKKFLNDLKIGALHPDIVQYKMYIKHLREKGNLIDLQMNQYVILKSVANFKQNIGLTVEKELPTFFKDSAEVYRSELRDFEKTELERIMRKRKRIEFVSQRFDKNKKLLMSLIDHDTIDSDTEHSTDSELFGASEDEYFEDDKHHKSKKKRDNKTNQGLDLKHTKSETKKTSGYNVFALFSTIRDVFIENPTTSLQTVCDAVSQVPALMATIPPQYSLRSFLELALRYLLNPPRLPQQAAGSSDIYVPPFLEYLKDTQQWRWKAAPSSQMNDNLESLEQLFYFAVTRKKEINSDDKGRVQIPFHLIKQQKCRVTIPNSTEYQVDIFRVQEKERFENCEKAYVFDIQGVKSIVAPLKKSSNPLLRAREHGLLVENRPAHINLLSLIRNAAARLPGGVGTRADVAHLMKDSQYVKVGSSDHRLNQVVSGALDRLQASPDPPVRYDPDQKLWIYLHRLRTEDDFLKVGQIDSGQATEEADGVSDDII